MSRTRGPGLAAGLCTLLLTGCTGGRAATSLPLTPSTSPSSPAVPVAATGGPHGTVRLAFAGDVHFAVQLAGLLENPDQGLGPAARVLARADVAMVNLETAIAGEGRAPDRKELERPDRRFHYRAPAAALEMLGAAGVDVVTMANNHGADYGPAGVADTLRAARRSPVAVVGIGRDRADALSPYTVSVRGTRLAFLAADTTRREGSSSVWAAGARTPGVAAARDEHPLALLAAVRRAAARADVVVVYLHWGAEGVGCPTARQQDLARMLAGAGADVVVGSHAHVLLGSGWLGGTYVDYGLGNFLWYHDHEPDSGVLGLTVRDGHVVADEWTPARVQPFGGPFLPHGPDRARALAAWRDLRACTALAADPGAAPLPAYSWSVRPMDRSARTHLPARCPVPARALRLLRLRYVGFDGAAHMGVMVVRADLAEPVAGVFGRLYAARWPIRRMRLVEAYGGDDRRSMAADNTSGWSCRRVAGTTRWSRHAFGAAVDVDPRENPDLTSGTPAPPGAAPFTALDRSGTTSPRPGVITARSPVVRAFARIGWVWGGTWSPPDHQHFQAPTPSKETS